MQQCTSEAISRTAEDAEEHRLDALRSYAILDTLPEPLFDDITRLASSICGAPISLISLIDADRQWFKSRVGLDVDQTHRDQAFCAHAIQNPFELMVVEDALEDRRFVQNPLVTNEPHIRFYAGYPLHTNSGETLGTLCVIDRVPRRLTAEQQEALRVLARQVMIQLELRREIRHAAETETQLRQMEKERETLILKLQHANTELEDFVQAASHDLKAPLRVMEKASAWLEEDLQPHLTDDTRESLTMLRSRVRRMDKLVDDLLAYARVGRKTDPRFEEIVTGAALLENIVALLSPAGFLITQSAEFAQLKVPRMPLQQILMNLIGNAVKHHNKETGCIDVSVQDAGAHYLFSVKDDGPGIAPQFHEQIFKMCQTLRPRDQVEGSGVGLAVVRKNVEIYGGTVSVESSEGAGSTFRFTLPKGPVAGEPIG